MILQGIVINGQIVLDQPQPLPEGRKVQIFVVEPPPPPMSHEEFVRRLRSLALDCGISLADDALSSEGLYD